MDIALERLRFERRAYTTRRGFSRWQRGRMPPRAAPEPLRAAPEGVISMTWPEYLLCQCWHHGRLVKLTPRHAELLLVFLLNRGRTLNVFELIERLYPEPDLEPEWAKRCIEFYIAQFHKRLPCLIEHVGMGSIIGWRIPA